MSFIAVVVQANNMTYADLCHFLKSEVKKKSAKPSQEKPPPIQPAASFSQSKKRHESKSHRRDLFTCWYCGKRGYMKGERCLRHRGQRNQDNRPFRNNPATTAAFRDQERQQNIRKYGNRHSHTVDRDQDVQKYPKIQSQHDHHQAQGFLKRLKTVSVKKLFCYQLFHLA